MRPAPWRVTHKRRDTEDTWTLELVKYGNGDVEPYAPGQFAMLYAFGAGEAPISVSEIGHRRLVHTVRAVGPTTRAICALDTGAQLGVRGPFGTSWPMEASEGSDVVIVAGGIGLAPVRPAILHVLANRERYGRVSVLYGGRSPADLLYQDDLERWRSRFDVDVDVTVDAAPGDWRGRVGLVTKLIPRAAFDPTDTVAMIVGPEVMMRFTALALRERGVPADQVHVSLERSMRCAIGLCGHCQLGPAFVCRDGPVVTWERAEALLEVRER
jgi:NAD(P)H-flavin reductase